MVEGLDGAVRLTLGRQPRLPGRLPRRDGDGARPRMDARSRCAAPGSSRPSKGRCRTCSGSWPAKTRRSSARSATRSRPWRWSRPATSRARAAARRCDRDSRRFAVGSRQLWPAVSSQQFAPGRHDRHASALLAIRSRRVRAGSTSRWRRCAATSCRQTRSREMAAAGVQTSIAVQVRQTPRGNPLDARARGRAPIHRRGGRVGGSAGRRRGRGARAACRSIRGLSASATSSRAKPDGFLDAHRPSAAASACLERARPDLRHPHLCATAARSGQVRARLSAAAFRPRSSGQAGHPRRRLRRAGGAISTTLAELPNVCCKLSGLVTEADWASWTPAQLRPYLDAALECFGPSRLMIGSDWPVCLVAASYARRHRAGSGRD